MTHANRILAYVAFAHAVVAFLCAIALEFEAAPVLGVHPALKPLKFAISLALFLGSFALLLPALSLPDLARSTLAVVLAAASSAEMIAIGAQAARGRTSHFNRATAPDAAFVTLMMIGVACIALALVAVTILATVRPLDFVGLALDASSNAILATGCRAALWLSLFTIVSGAMMGGRAQHTVGGPDGVPGLALVDWSRHHGDLRVSHFFALHALQIVPAIALLLARAPIATSLRWTCLGASVVGYGALVSYTFLQALASRPFA